MVKFSTIYREVLLHTSFPIFLATLITRGNLKRLAHQWIQENFFMHWSIDWYIFISLNKWPFLYGFIQGLIFFWFNFLDPQAHFYTLRKSSPYSFSIFIGCSLLHQKVLQLSSVEYPFLILLELYI